MSTTIDAENERSLENFLEQAPAMVQVWTNGRPLPTGTAVPFTAATFRVVTIERSPEGEVVRSRTEVDLESMKVNRQEDVVSYEKAFDVATAMQFAIAVQDEPSFCLWRRDGVVSPEDCSHWGQLPSGEATRLHPFSERRKGDAVLAAVVALALGETGQIESMYDVPDKAQSYVALAPPKAGVQLDAAAGILLRANRLSEEGSTEYNLIFDAQQQGPEQLPSILDRAWS